MKAFAVLALFAVVIVFSTGASAFHRDGLVVMHERTEETTPTFNNIACLKDATGVNRTLCAACTMALTEVCNITGCPSAEDISIGIAKDTLMCTQCHKQILAAQKFATHQVNMYCRMCKAADTRAVFVATAVAAAAGTVVDLAALPTLCLPICQLDACSLGNTTISAVPNAPNCAAYLDSFCVTLSPTPLVVE